MKHFDDFTAEAVPGWTGGAIDPAGPGATEAAVCFTPGTRLATPQGLRDVGDLRIGDAVVTRDHGCQTIRWIGRRRLPATGTHAPIRLRAGALTGLQRDIRVSPRHRVLLQGARAEMLTGEREVLAAAVDLIDGETILPAPGGTVAYVHLLFDAHEIVSAEGAWCESFHPATPGLGGLAAGARAELFALFPGLAALPGSYGAPARPCLTRNEARLILA